MKAKLLKKLRKKLASRYSFINRGDDWYVIDGYTGIKRFLGNKDAIKPHIISMVHIGIQQYIDNKKKKQKFYFW